MSTPPDKVAPLSAQRFGVQFTIDEATHELLRYAQALLGNAVAPGDVGEVFVRALKSYTDQLEKRRLGTGSRMRTSRGSSNPRYIPLAERRAVWKRDGGRCTFTSDGGHRCEATRALQFDHVIPWALGGESNAKNLRLRCHAHNQHAANQVLGERFMDGRRAGARERRAEARRRASVSAATVAAAASGIPPAPLAAPAEPLALSAAISPTAHPDVALGLRALGFRAPEIRDALLRCRAVADLPPGEQVRFALRGMAPRGARPALPCTGRPA